MNTVADRFWSKVDRGAPDACWLWQAMRNNRGYGVFKVSAGGAYRRIVAHRIAYMLSVGPLTDEQCLLHACDTPLCCNPTHLRIGTRVDNNLDRDSKQRQARGEGQAAAKLTEDDVRRIRELSAKGMPKTHIARMYGVSDCLIGFIVRRSAWSHVA